MTEGQKEQQLADVEIKKYGRMWMWEGYFNEKNKGVWLETAEQLKHINQHVLQDIEDSILLEGFKKQKRPSDIRDLITVDHKQRVNEMKKNIKDLETFEAKELQNEKKRKFLNEIRPPKYWNFFEDVDESEKVPHVLRYNAKPP